MEKKSERLYVFKELLKSTEDIKNGQTYSAEEVKRNMTHYLDSLEKDDVRFEKAERAS